MQQSEIDHTILIVGGGIGGLTAALSLAREGWSVAVFEQSADFTEVGAGIQLSPNCTRVLFHLGLEDQLRALAFVPEATLMRDFDTGTTHSRQTLGQLAVEKYGFPYFHVHRADLIGVLLSAVTNHPNITLMNNVRCEYFVQSTDEASIELGDDLWQGAAIIGADGIHSAVREALFGAHHPRFTGNVAWRGLVPASSLPRELVSPGATVWMGPHKHFVTYYVRQGDLVNCVCVVEKKGWEVESWSARGDHAELKADFAGWHNTVLTLIDNMDPGQCFKWALYDRDPLPQWSQERITLLGDACHPTLPFMAQGAAMAIEDAAVLTTCLQETTSVQNALKRYEQLRLPRTTRIQKGSRRNAKVFHLSGPAAWARNLALAKAGDKVMDTIYRYDAYHPDH